MVAARHFGKTPSGRASGSNPSPARASRVAHALIPQVRPGGCSPCNQHPGSVATSWARSTLGNRGRMSAGVASRIVMACMFPCLKPWLHCWSVERRSVRSPRRSRPNRQRAGVAQNPNNPSPAAPATFRANISRKHPVSSQRRSRHCHNISGDNPMPCGPACSAGTSRRLPEIKELLVAHSTASQECLRVRAPRKRRTRKRRFLEIMVRPCVYR